jgi:hypothetical protein
LRIRDIPLPKKRTENDKPYFPDTKKIRNAYLYPSIVLKLPFLSSSDNCPTTTIQKVLKMKHPPLLFLYAPRDVPSEK